MLFEVDEHGGLSPLDSATRLPEGAYTTLRTYGGHRVLRLEQHVARLADSARLQGAATALDAGRVQRGLAAALVRARLAEARARLTFAPPRLYVGLELFDPLPAALYAGGVACALVEVRRHDPHAKDTRFLAAADAARARLPAGVHEGLMVDAGDGALLEGLSSNFFAVTGGALHTEDQRVLHGVTRAVVLELASALLPVRLRAIRRADLGRVDEAFLTSVSRGVLPVVRVHGQVFGDGAPGPITRALMRRFEELAAREARDVTGGAIT